MVEHMSCALSAAQSFNGAQPPRWQQLGNHRHPRLQLELRQNSAPPVRQRFSLFRWFKRRDSTSSADNQHHRRARLFRRSKRRGSSSSDSSSDDTFYSTATVRSFAFQSGVLRRSNAPTGLKQLEQSRVGPFAPGAAKLVERRAGSEQQEIKGRLDTTTSTLPSGFSQRQDLQTRYSILPPPGNPFISYDSIPLLDRRPRSYAEVRRNGNYNNRNVTVDTLTSDSSAASAGPRRGVHVKGKRRAPDPPITQRVLVVHVSPATGAAKPAAGGRRKRRPAPKPPGYRPDNGTLSSNQDTLSSETSAVSGMDSMLLGSRRDSQTISNDTLVLRRGVLLSKKEAASESESRSRTPTTCGDSDGAGTIVSNKSGTLEGAARPSAIMPRPWYKRTADRDSSGSQSRRGAGDILRGLTSPVPPAEPELNVNVSATSSVSSSFPFEGSLSRLGFFQRSTSDDKKKESNKRRSGVSILTNISELDKEAAAIVQEEQARNRASMLLQAAKLDEEFERRMGANEEIVQEILNSSLESSPRRSTRALITRFNALGSSGLFRSSGSPKAKQRHSGLDLEPSKCRSPPRRDPTAAALFAEVINPGRTADVKPAASRSPTTASAAAATSAPVTPASPKPVKREAEAEFVKSLAAELDDVASGIAKLRRELDERPKAIDAIDRTTPEKKLDPPKQPVKSEPLPSAACFEREFGKIFDELDRQLRTRDTRPVRSSEASISNQVAKVLDILASAEKEKAEKPKEDAPRPRVQRISGVDDRTTAELKEMLKEMKHSLPKRPVVTEKPVAVYRLEEPAAPARAATKVSSGVQTSGNVRRIEPIKSPVYQLIKPSEFEAAKGKTARLENAYANVVERVEKRGLDNAAAPALPPRPERKPSVEKSDASEEGEKLEEIKKQYMNTMAVNRLLRKLEAAIASGNHQQAAGLAKELAQLKIHCSVVRQRSCSAQEKLNLKMYIEDKQAHQGPIPLQLPTNMTVAQLKAKIHIEYEIPANVQRWIIGKNLADNDDSTLEELQATEGSPVFLYLVAPPDLQDKEAIKPDKREEKAEQAVPLVEEPEEQQKAPDEKTDEQVQEIKPEIVPEPEAEPAPTAATAAAEPPPAEEPPPAPEQEESSAGKEEKLKRYEELMSLENCDVISNSEPIECPVCFMITIPGEGVILRDCLHSFCRICVANTVRYCEEAEVKCPYRDPDYTCESTLQEREIKALVEPEVYQQHLAKSIAQAENNAGNNAFHCKTPDCPGWCIYDDNVNNFLCPVCKANNCLTCQAIHMGKNCRQYQEELKYSKETDHESKRTAAMLEDMVDRGEALPCPTCAVVLMKKWGCDWLRCSMCKTEICWVTRGPRWGPGGKGDTSGGCRCGENGVKCHPRCNYCH